MLILWLVASLAVQDTVPYKPSDEFELKIAYEFRTPPGKDINKVELTGNTHSALFPLPYVRSTLRVLKASPNESRIRITDNLGRYVLNRKLEMERDFIFDLGYAADIKDRTGAYEYTILFLSSKKEVIHKIVVEVARDGTFMVNKETRGKI